MSNSTNCPPGYAIVPRRDLFEAAVPNVDEEGTEYVLIKKVELLDIRAELSQQRKDQRGVKADLEALKTTAQNCAITVTGVTDALAKKFGLSVAVQAVDEEECVRPPGQQGDEFEEVETLAVIPAHNSTATHSGGEEILDVVGGTTSTPKKSRKRKAPAPSKTDERKTVPAKKHKGEKAADKAPSAMKAQKEGKAADDIQRYKSKRIATPLQDGSGCVVSWTLNSKGHAPLSLNDMSRKADELTGIKSILARKKLAKLWESDAGGVVDLAVGLVNHVAATYLSDLAEKGCVVLQSDMPECAGDDSEEAFIGKMPEPIKTAVSYVAAMCFVGTETEEQRRELLDDCATNVKPYVDAIRKGHPFITD